MNARSPPLVPTATNWSWASHMSHPQADVLDPISHHLLKLLTNTSISAARCQLEEAPVRSIRAIMNQTGAFFSVSNIRRFLHAPKHPEIISQGYVFVEHVDADDGGYDCGGPERRVHAVLVLHQLPKQNITAETVEDKSGLVKICAGITQH